MRYKGAFTLVELLVVISIISLLVTILLPSLSMAKELARRGGCAANLRSIGISLNVSATNSDTQFPDNGEVDHHWRAIGRFYKFEDQQDNRYSNTAGIYQQIVSPGAVAPKAFVCSSAPVTPEDYTVDECYDFPSRNSITYSFQNQKRFSDRPDYIGTTLLDSPNLAIMADRNACHPKAQWNNYNPVTTGGGYFVSDDTKKGLNSENHDLEGQNVLFLDSRVTWCTHPRVGIGDDNIWTKSDGTDDGEGPSLSYSKAPTDGLDSFLVP